jgi:apolipoprotein N-acyltransferase
MLLSAGLQISVFPLPNLYFLCWAAIAPLLVALLRTREPDTLQLRAGVKLLPARPVQAFLLAYCCGILWYAGTCYWIYNTMRQYGGVGTLAALGLLFLFCLYLALYHGFFGLLVSLLANSFGKSGTSSRSEGGGTNPGTRQVLLLAPFLWVAVELARTRVTGFPWDLLGIAQVDNIPLARIATATGVYGLSFEIMVVNTALAAAFVIRGERGRRSTRSTLLLATVAAVVVLQAGRLISLPPFPTDHSARLVQANVPILQGSDWTKEYFEGTLRDLSLISLSNAGKGQVSAALASPSQTGSSQDSSTQTSSTQTGSTPTSDTGASRTSGALAPTFSPPDLIVWPESPAPFYTSDPSFRDGVSNIARQAQTWVLVGNLGIRNAGQTPQHATQLYNSASLVSPGGEWVGRYDKIHLVPLGEYVPFKRVFGFAAGLTNEVGDF